MRDAIAFHAFPLVGIEPMSASTARAFPRHTHDEYGIGVVDAGGHASWSGRGQVEARPGHFICVNPGEVHDGRAIGGQPRSWRILYFAPAALADMRADITEGAQGAFTFAAPVFADRRLRESFEAAFRHATPQAELDAAMPCETAILRLVARLSAHSTARPQKDEGPTACIWRARHRIDADPAAPVTLMELAKEAGLSRYQLIRAFARELGLTPHSYILQRRIALAQRLIRAGCDLAEVATAAGFCDQSHLTRWFVRQFGVTPRRYSVVAR
ncbi:MAG TPA: AraC family transcriptional regulator [Steroidobacteraceae bacterium]|nr:AraC family transcriptional regulator [Steroidobacteraceae bacterium]